MNTVSLGPVTGLADGAGVRFDADGERLAAFFIDGTVHVIDDRCSHAEASLADGEVFDNEVECPKHGAAFDVTTGAALTLPATKPVRSHDAAVVDGEVVVTITKESSE